MTIITGGAGFIGSHLTTLLVARGERVVVVEKPGVDCSHLAGCEIRYADITDRRGIALALKGARYVYHLAADPNLWERQRGHFHRTNFLGTVNVLDAARGAERILHCSTESILTRRNQSGPIREDAQAPLAEVIGLYCRSKHFAEQYAMKLAHTGSPIVVVNPTIPVGPGDRGSSPPTRMMKDFLKSGRRAYLDADLNLIDVRDVALGMMLAMDRGRVGQRYLLGAENWSVKRVFDLLAEIRGLPKPTWKVPYAVALTAAYVSEFLADVVTGESPAATITGVKLAGRRMTFDASARALPHWDWFRARWLRQSNRLAARMLNG